MPEPPTRLDLLRFSYEEVLDATKHQDDKVGRLLGAVAFLTGGALVFADTTLLQVEVVFSTQPAQQYPLGAVLLGAFLVLDLVAVASYLIAMAAPLKLPHKRSGGPPSLLYFRAIAGRTEPEWNKCWANDDAGSAIEDGLPDEIMNLALRADRKYGRTTIATNIFLGALAVLAPAVVVGLAAAANDGPPPLEWTATVRWCVAVSIGALALALLIPLGFRAADHDSKVNSRPFWILIFAYTSTLLWFVVAEGGSSYGQVGIVPGLILGVASVVLALRAFTTPPQAVPHAVAIAAIVLAGCLAWANDRADLQLYVAVLGCVLIVLPNIIDELTHNKGSGSPSRTREQTAAVAAAANEPAAPPPEAES